MRIVKPSFEVLWRQRGADMLKDIEAAGRTAYKSQAKITEESAETFVKSLISRGHYSVLEHISVSVRFVFDRGISHELVRHRLAAYTQESTRFCNYSDEEKFGGQIAVVLPAFLFDASKTDPLWLEWHAAMDDAERHYFNLLKFGAKAQEARSVLPISLKTEIVATYDLRTWRHVYFLRTPETAHPDMRRVMIPLLEEFRRHIPVIFDTLEE